LGTGEPTSFVIATADDNRGIAAQGEIPAIIPQWDSQSGSPPTGKY